MASDHKSIDLGHVEIGDDKVRPLGVHHCDRLGPGRGRQARVAVPHQNLRTRRHHVGIIIDNEDSCDHGSGCQPSV